MSEPLIRVLIADDQPCYQHALALDLRNNALIEICGQAANGEELLLLDQTLQPDIILIDIRMPLLDGIAATRQLKQNHSNARLIALTQYNDESLILSMIAAGADGYILKQAATGVVAQAILQVFNGEYYLCASASRALFNMLRLSVSTTLPPNFLSSIEKSILTGICRQLTSKEIAEQLRVSNQTIERYRTSLMRKTGACNLAGLVLFALKHHIYSLDEYNPDIT